MNEFVRNTLLVLCALALGFLTLEVGVRLYRPDIRLLTLTNFIYDQVSLLRSGYPSRFDAELGYIPRPGYSGIANVWGTQVTIDQQGVRSNGQPPPDAVEAPAILALGDSFVFGDQVSDSETWPAQLERKLRQRVINGGVFGYAVDQSVLRAYPLIDRYQIGTIILTFIADDIRRTQLAVRTGVAKPYFELDHGDLIRRNDPVPPLAQEDRGVGLLRSILGYSLLLDLAMKRLGLEEWWYAGRWSTVQVHDDGVEVACRLIDQLRRDTAARGIHLVVLAQYPSWEITDPDAPKNRQSQELTQALLACLRQG
ncbi:MAG: SGNH/GDSL hydrolase family protein, partial [Geminicoccaceae bacterium]